MKTPEASDKEVARHAREALGSGDFAAFRAAADAILEGGDEASVSLLCQEAGGMSAALRATACQVTAGGRRAALFCVPVTGAGADLHAAIGQGGLVQSVASSLVQAPLLPGGFEVSVVGLGIHARDMEATGPIAIRDLARRMADSLLSGSDPSAKRALVQAHRSLSLSVPEAIPNAGGAIAMALLGIAVAPPGWSGHWIANNPLGLVNTPHPPAGVPEFLERVNSRLAGDLSVLPLSDWDTANILLDHVECDLSLVGEAKAVARSRSDATPGVADEAHLFLDPATGTGWVCKRFGEIVAGPVQVPLDRMYGRPSALFTLLSWECRQVVVHGSFSSLRAVSSLSLQ